jgi:hypothetical protein
MSVLLTFHFLSLQGAIRNIISRVIVMPAYVWLRYVFAIVMREVLHQVHGFAVSRVPRCVLFSFFYSFFWFLIFFSLNARIGHLTDELRGAIIRGDIPHVGHTVGRLVFHGAKVALIRAAIGVLEKVLFFPCF